MTTENLFNELYEVHYEYVLKYVICKCHNLDNVEDIIQNIFLKLYNILEKNIDYATNYKGLLIKLAKNELFNYYSLKNKLKEVVINDEEKEILANLEDVTINLEDDLMQKGTVEEIWQEIKKEDILNQKILTLYFMEEEKLKDIAVSLELSESTVKTRLYRSIERIKNNLKKEC